LVWACQGAGACCAAASPAPKSTLNAALIAAKQGRWRFAMAFPFNFLESRPKARHTVERHCSKIKAARSCP
jgi:hypothetical protein